MAHPTELIINAIKNKNAFTVQFVSGQITDSYMITKVYNQLMEVAQKPTGPKLILDFGNVTNISSEALGKLLTLHKTAAESGGSVSLAAVDDANIRSVFQITQLDKVFSIYSSVTEAEEQL